MSEVCEEGEREESLGSLACEVAVAMESKAGGPELAFRGRSRPARL